MGAHTLGQVGNSLVQTQVQVLLKISQMMEWRGRRWIFIADESRELRPPGSVDGWGGKRVQQPILQGRTKKDFKWPQSGQSRQKGKISGSGRSQHLVESSSHLNQHPMECSWNCFYAQHWCGALHWYSGITFTLMHWHCITIISRPMLRVRARATSQLAIPLPPPLPSRHLLPAIRLFLYITVLSSFVPLFFLCVTALSSFVPLFFLCVTALSSWQFEILPPGVDIRVHRSVHQDVGPWLGRALWTWRCLKTLYF